MNTLWQDIRYGFRMLWKNPGFTVIATLALALGIGANTAIFSVVNATLLRPLPYKEAERLVMVWNREPEDEKAAVAPADFLDWREQNTVFEQMAASRSWSFNLTQSGQPERILGAVTNASLFPLLGVSPAIGRTFLPEEETTGNGRVVVLSHGIWQRLFGSNPGVIGQKLALNGESFTVVGVMPEGFQYPQGAEVWVPPRHIVPESPTAGASADATKVRDNHYLRVIARLKPQATLNQAKAEMETITRQLEQQYPQTNTGFGVNLVPLREDLTGKIQPALVILFCAVGFVLLIACANVANLLLARATARRREIAIRTALGASRWRVVRQLLTESVLLSVTGGGLGLLVALWGIPSLLAISPLDIRRVKEIGIDAQALGFTLLVSLLTGIIFGLAPALQASNPDLNESLKESARGSAGGVGRSRLRSMLVVAEVALSLLLLVSAGLMIRSFLRLQEVSPGFSAGQVLTAQLTLSRPDYSEDRQRAALLQQVLARVEAQPGVASASATSTIPLGGGEVSRSFTVGGQPPPEPGKEPTAEYRAIGSHYFRTMGTPLLKGRDFTERDDAQSPAVVMINETMARRYWPNEDPVGRSLKLDGMEKEPREIVGVVGDVRHFGLDARAEAEMYVPYLQRPMPGVTLMVRSASAPGDVAAAVRNAVREADRNLPVYNVKSMDEILADSVSSRRFNMLLLGIFAAVALVLAAVGIYGVMAYSVTQRTHEIGIRMALGAEARDILKLVVGQGMILTLIGLAVGLAASLALTRLLASLLYGVTATDPLTFAGVSLLLAVVALLACYIPARRAMKVDPMVALRYE
ncbi:MAG: ABC transporter permease [Pyrinomonadaceae bacterium]